MFQYLQTRSGVLQRHSGQPPVAGLPAPSRSAQGCVDGRWQFQYDGCSVPLLASAVAAGQRGANFDKENPAGGKDTHFAHGVSTLAGGGACDRHDECYQSCGSDRLVCDRRIREDMLSTCDRSRENDTIKAACRQWAEIYYSALRVGGQGAHDDRQRQVCSCGGGARGPAFQYPPLELLTRPGTDGGRVLMNWVEYLLAQERPPLSAYRPLRDSESYDRYVATGTAGPGER